MCFPERFPHHLRTLCTSTARDRKPNSMKSCIVLLAISARAASGYALPAAAAAMPRLRGLDRTRIATMGFEVEDIDDQAVAELGVFSWPGLEKRTSTTQSAGAEELLMVFVQSGTARSPMMRSL